MSMENSLHNNLDFQQTLVTERYPYKLEIYNFDAV